MINQFLAFVIGLSITLGAGIWLTSSNNNLNVGGGLGTIEQLSQWRFDGTNITQNVASSPIKLTGYESSGDCLVTDASGVVSTDTCGAGGSSNWVDGTSTVYPTEGRYALAPQFIATSTSLFSQFLNIGTNVIKASSSAGILLEASNGTDVADFGAGGGSNTTFYGGVNIDGQTRIATSITGLIKAASGVLSAAVADTDYQVPLTFGDALTRTANDIDFDGGATPAGDLGGTWASPSVTDDSHAHTGTTLSGIDISSDTNLAGDSEIVLTGDTLSIAASIARDSELHSAVTLSGVLDYITLVGQDIVRGAIDLATDVTGALGIANGGLGAAFTDPNADRLMFWDDSSGFITGIATLAGATISGTTLTIDDVTCTDCLTTTEIADSYLLNNGDVGTGAYDFGGATSLEIPNGTGPTVDATGECAWDTTDDQLKCADGGGTSRVVGHDEFRVISTTIASTSLAFTSGQTLAALSYKDGLEITQFRCYVVGGTSKIVNLTDGTNDTETITCATTVTSDTDVATNDTFTADELGYIEFGASSGSPNYLHLEVWARITGE